MAPEVNRPIPSGRYTIEKIFIGDFQRNSIQAGGSSAPVVMTSAPQTVPVPWTIEKKDKQFFTMMVNEGFASKVGDEKFLYTRPEGSSEIQEWELIPVLTHGPKVYYIRSRGGQAWTVSGKPKQMEVIPVGLKDLGEVRIPEGPPEEFLFTISEAE